MGGKGITTGCNHDHKGNRSEVKRKQGRIIAKRKAQTLKVHRIECARVKATNRTGKAARKNIKADRRREKALTLAQEEMAKEAEAAAAAPAAAEGTKKGKKGAGGVAAMDTA